MLVALYARVSSERQAERDLSIPAQLSALREYALAQGHEVIQEFIDEAESAQSADRPAFQQMIALAKQRPPSFEAILVWKLSRFARNREDAVIYKGLLRRQGVQLISITEPTDDTPTGRLLEGFLEVMDEFYSANLGAEVVRGMREAASRGQLVGGQVPVGYRKTEATNGANDQVHLEPDPEWAPVVRRIFHLCADEHLSLRHIGKKLMAEGLPTPTGGTWSSSTLRHILSNELYLGHMVWNRHDRRGKGHRKRS